MSIELPPVKVALIIDNKIVDILHTDERLGAIFLSEPTLIDVTDSDGGVTAIVGSTYDPATGTFSAPDL